MRGPDGVALGAETRMQDDLAYNRKRRRELLRAAHDVAQERAAMKLDLDPTAGMRKDSSLSEYKPTKDGAKR